MKTDETLSKPDSRLQTKAESSIGNFEAIEEYLNSGEEKPLTDLQEKLLERWTFADELMRNNVGRLKKEEVANRLKLHFTISKSLAYRDIVDAEKLFSSTTPLNKKYRIQLRIEFLESQIRLCAVDNDHFSAKQYEIVLQNYYKMYPEISPVESPKTFFFAFDVSKLKDSFIDSKERDSILDIQASKNKLLDSMTLDAEEYDDDFEEVRDE